MSKFEEDLDSVEEEVKEEKSAFADQSPEEKEWKNRQRTLILMSRGVTSRARHLVVDMMNLIPQMKKEAKMERKSVKESLDELCEARSCNNYLYFETRKRKDLYMWLGKSPDGPSVKFSVFNIHTCDELKLTGNCLKHSRPMLTFDSAFTEQPYLALIKEMFVNALGTPKNHPKSKPFVDHVFAFSFVGGKIWFRNY